MMTARLLHHSRPWIVASLVATALSSTFAAPPPLRLDSPRTLAPDALGVNGNVLSVASPATNQDFHAALRATHTGLFRYPAGTIANTWDWDIGGIDPTVADDDLIAWVRKLDRSPTPAQPYGIPQIARIQAATGQSVAFVLNMLTRDLEHSLRGLRRARDAGLPIRYIEMGNELYFNLRLESRVFPTPEDYGRVSNEWILAIKAEFPGVQCALVAGGRPDRSRSERWIERALSTCPTADAIVVHRYTPTGLTGPMRRNVTAGTEGTVETDPSLPPAERQRGEMDLLLTPAGLRLAMTTAHSSIRGARDYAERTGKPIWLTEWNLRADQDAFRGTWAHTLFIATMLHGIFETPAITISHYHNITSSIFGAVYQEPTELNHVALQNLTSTPWTLTPGGQALSCFGRVATGRTTVARIHVPGSEEWPHLNGQFLPSAYGWHFTAGAKSSAVLVNLGSNPITIDGSGLAASGTPTLIFAGSLDTYIESEASVPPQPGKLGAVLTLPSHSITLINPD